MSTLLITPKAEDIAGQPILRPLPAAKCRSVGPFVFFDHMLEKAYAPGSGMNINQHPHIGLSTLTYLFEGELQHKDSLGSDQLVKPGDVSWMSAGRAVAHVERTPDHLRQKGSRLHGLQVWLALPQLSAHADEIPEIASLLLTQLAERGEVPSRRFAVGALNALRIHRWQGDWPELQAAVKNLALSALDEEIVAEDVARILQTELRETSEAPSLLPFFEQPLREARDAFERLYFEHALRLEGGNMTRVADKAGLERTHLYRKLKQLGIQICRRGEE